MSNSSFYKDNLDEDATGEQFHMRYPNMVIVLSDPKDNECTSIDICAKNIELADIGADHGTTSKVDALARDGLSQPTLDGMDIVGGIDIVMVPIPLGIFIYVKV